MNRLSIVKIISIAIFMVSTPFAFAYGNSQTLTDGNTTHSERADSAITAEIKAKFMKEKLFGEKDVSAMTIGVETNDGIVRLTGTAENNAQIKNAEKLATSVSGVKKVLNDVTVSDIHNQ